MKNPFLTETALLKLDWAEHHCKTRLQYLVRSGLSALNNCLVVWFNLILTWISFNRLFFSGEAFVSLSSDKDISLLGKKMFSLAFCELLCHKVKADWPWTEFITVFKDNLTTPIGTNSPVILYLIFFWFFFVENIMLTYFPIFTHSLFHATAWLLEEQFHRSMDDTEKRIHFKFIFVLVEELRARKTRRFF